jgi:hypothetical protein
MKRLLTVAAVLALGGVAAAEEGPLRMETVDRVIEQHDRAIQSCHRGANRHDTLAVQLLLEIDPAGIVTSALPVDKPSAEAQCLARLAKKLHFPSTGMDTHIAYPFMLMPQLHH